MNPNDVKLLILWPRYEPGKKEFFKVFLENFDATIIFIAFGEKGRYINSGNTQTHIREDWVVDLEELEIYKEKGNIIFLNYPHFRASKFTIFQALTLLKSIYRIITGCNWDFVLFSTQAPLHSKIAYFICKLKNIRCGAKIERWEDYQTKNPLMRLYQRLDKAIIKGVDVTFPHGKAAQAYCKKLSKNKPSLILPYIISDFGEPSYSETFQKIVYCGAITAQKNPYGAVKSFLSSPVLRGRAKFVLAGEGPEMDKIRTLVNQHNDGDDVLFMGAYDPEELPEVLDEKSVYVLPSHKDGWSFATLEAACLGRPLILSKRVGAHVDLLREGTNGYVVSDDNENEITEAMEKIITCSPEKALDMQKASRRIFEDHNKKERVISAIQEAITSS
jgi:glycosyltransferase involved in cell wall biosynthesis